MNLIAAFNAFVARRAAEVDRDIDRVFLEAAEDLERAEIAALIDAERAAGTPAKLLDAAGACQTLLELRALIEGFHSAYRPVEVVLVPPPLPEPNLVELLEPMAGALGVNATTLVGMSFFWFSMRRGATA